MPVWGAVAQLKVCWFETHRRQSLCCVLEQDTETGIKQDKKSPRSDWDEKYQSKQTFYPLPSTGSTQVDPSRQDRTTVDSDVQNQTKQMETSKRTTQILLLCPLRFNSH